MEQDFDRAMTPFSWSNPYAWPRKPLLAQNVVCHLAAARRAGGAADARRRRQRGGRDPRHRDHADAGRAGVQRHRLGRLRASSGTARKLHGLNASGRSPAAWTPEYFRGKAASAGARLGFGHRAGLRLGVGGAARQVRQAAVPRSSSSRRSATAARASWSRRPSPGSGQAQVAEAEGPARLRRGVPAGRTRAARRRKVQCSRNMPRRWKRSPPRRARRSIAASSPRRSRRTRRSRAARCARPTWPRTGPTG